jgi:DNA topoisomerase-3
LNAVAKSLVITEKPSVTRDIAEALGGFREEDGYFEGENYVITFAVGHLYELLSPEELDPKYKRWTLEALPILPDVYRYKVKKGQSDRIRTIKRLLQRDDIDSVVNACDAGREGELIFREIVEQLESAKPIRRLWLQSMTDDAIRAGFRSLRPGTELDGLAAAASCRARSDWLIGMNATRALTKRLKSRKETTAWSAGRVQTPTLAMLVERELEILAHVPRPYYSIEAQFEHNGARYAGAWYDPEFREGADDQARDDRVFDEARAREIVAAVTGGRGKAEESRKPSRESAPPLFDLTSLQREGNRRFGWSARRTLAAAQRCYERHKLLTYPRTDSRCLPSDYRETVAESLRSFAGGRSQGAEFAEYASAAERLQRDGLENESRVFNDAGVSDHFAIIPTGKLPREALTGDDKRLFDLVVRRFLGAFHPPAEWERVERTTIVAGQHFRTRDRFLREKGWRAVLPPGSDEEGARLPALVPGDDGRADVAVAEVASTAEETRPPARISEARLLSLMENAGEQVEDDDIAAVMHEKGIGTPATRADIIENLIAKGYAVRVDKALRPTVKGIRLIDTLRRIHADRITSPALTGEIENHLLEVERGRRSEPDFMREIVEYASEIVARAKGFQYEELYANEPPLGPCPACGRPVIEMAWFYRCKPEPDVEPEKDCPLRFWKDTSGRYVDRQSVAKLIAEGKTGPLEGFTARSGRTYKGFLELDKSEGESDPSKWRVKVRSLGYEPGQSVSDTPEYEVDPEPLGRCPLDEECNIVETPTHFVCERKLKAEEPAKGEDAPKTCGFQLPRTVCKREITRDEALVYLRDGKTELLADFTSRFGRPFSAMLVLKENGRHGFEFPPRGKAAAAAESAGEGSDTASAAPARARAPRRAAAKAEPRTETKRPRRKAAARKAGAGKPKRGRAARSARRDEPSGTES